MSIQVQGGVHRPRAEHNTLLLVVTEQPNKTLMCVPRENRCEICAVSSSRSGLSNNVAHPNQQALYYYVRCHTTFGTYIEWLLPHNMSRTTLIATHRAGFSLWRR